MVWEALGAVIGAGFASGQELSVFFSRFGGWSVLAIASALAAVYLLTRRVFTLGEAAFGRRSWRAAFAALAIVSGGAMTAAAGEIAALALPLHGARYIGMAAAMALSWLCAERNTPLLRRLCQGMMAVLLAMLAICARLPAQRAAVAPGLTGAGAAMAAAAYGVSWAGFNLSLAAPMLARRGESRSAAEQRRSARWLTLLLGILLIAGNATLLRHPLEMHGVLPLVRLTARLGKPGFALCCATLLLAEISTLAASLRTLRQLLPRQWLWGSCAAMLVLACAGFGAVVSRLYPALGALCTALLLLPKENALQPAKDVL